MEYLIEQKVIDLLEVSMVDGETDYIPNLILPYAEDWEDPFDYPVIVVQIDGEENVVDQIANLPTFLKSYTLSIYAITVDDLWEDVVYGRNVLKTRIINTLKNNQYLDHLSDNDSAEKVFMVKYQSTDFSVAGFRGMWQALARIRYEVLTEVSP